MKQAGETYLGIKQSIISQWDLNIYVQKWDLYICRKYCICTRRVVVLLWTFFLKKKSWNKLVGLIWILMPASVCSHHHHQFFCFVLFSELRIKIVLQLILPTPPLKRFLNLNLRHLTTHRLVRDLMRAWDSFKDG